MTDDDTTVPGTAVEVWKPPARPETGEVLDRPLKPDEAKALEDEADYRMRRMTGNSFLFAVALRRLQDGDAHRLAGYRRFGEYVEWRFQIADVTARGLSRDGKVLIVLADAGRIVLDEDLANVVGARAMRKLAEVYAKHGEVGLLATWDRARGRAGDRAITTADVEAVMLALWPAERKEPRPVKPTPSPPPRDDSEDPKVENLSDDEPNPRTDDGRELAEVAEMLRDSIAHLMSHVRDAEEGRRTGKSAVAEAAAGIESAARAAVELAQRLIAE